MPIGRPAAARARQLAACAGSTRTTTTGEPSSRLSAPSGSADAKLPISMASARRASPSVVTSRRPRRHGVSVGRVAEPGAERGHGHHQRARQPGAGDPGGGAERAPARDPVGPAAQVAGQRLVVLAPRGVLAAAVLDGDLLDDDALGGEHGGGRQAGQRAAERRAEQLGLRVGDDEDGEGRGGGQAARRPAEHRDGRAPARGSAPRAARCGHAGARRSWRPLPDQARDREQGGHGQEPRDHPLGHGPEVADAPAAAVVGVADRLRRSGRSSPAWPGRSARAENFGIR